MNGSVPVLAAGSWLRRLLGFIGPGYMISVGYMDPGNWATDIAGGSQFGYTLLFVILLSNLMAIVLQALSARLGIATGRDLAQACRDHYSRPVGFVLWIACEAAIIACDLAEVIGTAIALKLLFGIPLILGARHHGPRRVPGPAPDAPGLPGARSLRDRAAAGHLRLLRASRSPWRRPPLQAVLAGFLPIARDRHQPGGPLHRHRHHRGDGDAPQPLPALLHRADARLSAHGGGPPQRAALCRDRFHHRPDAGAVRQRLDPDHGGRRCSTPAAARTWRRSSRPTSCSRRCSASASPRPCSPWRSWPRASTRRSRRRSPARS